jgi:hypothetical protein
VNRRLSALILSAAGAAALIVLPSGRGTEAAEADPAVVETYLAQLSETTPRDPAVLGTPEPLDPKRAKKAGRLDRAEPIIDGVFSAVR